MSTKPFVTGTIILTLLLLLNFSSGWLNWLLQLMTLMILVIVYGLFASSLLQNSTPLISRYAILMDKTIGQKELNYTRKVTWAWVVLLTGILVAKTDALFFQQACLENRLTNHLDALSFLSMAILFIGEFHLRKRLFPHKDHGSIHHFILAVSRISLKTIWQFKSQQSPDQNNCV